MDDQLPESPKPTGASPKFCSSFWTEGVLRIDGKFQFCCRNSTVLGDWAAEGLAAVWHSPLAQEFRRKAARGEFPTDDCRKCHDVGATYPLGRPLASQLWRHRRIVEDRFGGPLPELEELQQLFERRHMDDEARGILARYGDGLARLAPRAALAGDEECVASIEKLRLLEQVVRSFLEGDENPPVVAPSREINLIATCNARCVHCPGLHANQLTRGIETSPGVFARHIAPGDLAKAFEADRHIFEFWCNGTEFLVYPGWKDVYRRLVRSGVMLSMSTNGIGLNKDAVHTLIDGKALAHLNVSIDGATPETIEAIRVNVKYRRLVANVRYLVEYARQRSYVFTLNFTFTFMRRNFRELAQFVDFVHAFYDGGPALPGTILFTPLLEGDEPSYRAFLGREHHALVDRRELEAQVREARRRCERYGLAANVTYTQTIGDFIAAGCPFPPLPSNVIPAGGSHEAVA